MDFMNPASQMTLEDISYEWLESCTDPAQLKHAIRLIEEDGNYFVDLKKAIQEKLASLPGGPAYLSGNQKAQNQAEKQSAIDEILNWREKMQSAEKNQPTSEKPVISMKKQNIPDISKKQAENEKNKGNEAMTSGDFKEAIGYYSSAIALDSQNPIYFGNRAMAYIKMKDFRKAIEDATAAVNIDRGYTKGFYRRAKANEAMGNYYATVCDFAEILHLEKENKEVVSEMEKMLKKLNPNELTNFQIFKENLELPEKTSKVEPKKVKIQIEEEDDEEENEEAKAKEIAQSQKDKVISALNQRFIEIEDKKIRLGSFLEAAKDLELISKELEASPNFFDDTISLLFLLTIYNKIAFCYKQSELEKQAIEFCSKAIAALDQKFIQHSLTPKESEQLVEALTRRGTANEAIERFESAYSDYHLALSIQPGSAQAQQGLNRTSKLVPVELKAKLDSDKSLRIYDREKSKEVFPTEEKTKTPPNEFPQEKQESELKNSEQKSEEKIHKELWVNCTEEARSEIEQLKQQGNDDFKKEKFEEAVRLYSQGIALIEPPEVSERSLSFHFVKAEDKQLYIDLLSNRSLANFYARNFKTGFYDANSLSLLAQNNPKVIYRRAINAEKIAEQSLEAAKNSTDIFQRSDCLESAREKALVAIADFEQLLQQDPKGQKLLFGASNSKNLLDSITRLQAKNAQALEITQPKQIANPDEKTNNSHENIDKKQEGQAKGPSKKLVQSIEQKTSSIAQTAIKEMLEGQSLPQNSSQFETDVNALKGNEELTLKYLSRFDLKSLAELYSKKQFEFKTFTKIIASLNKAVFELKLQKSEFEAAKFLAAFSLSYNFKLTLKMLLKREKIEMKKLITAIKQNALEEFKQGLMEIEKLLEV